MEEVKDKVEELSGHVKDYLGTLYELTALKLVQQLVNIATFAANSFLLIFFSLLVLMIGGIGLGWWLGDVMHSRAGGFLVVAGFYLVCLICLMTIMKKIIFSGIRNSILKKIYEKTK
jgi:hypothetical protein